MKTYLLTAAILFGGIASAQSIPNNNINVTPKGLFFPDKVNCPGLHKQFDAKLNLSMKFHFNESGSTELLSPGKLIFNPVAEVAFSPIEHLYIMASYRSQQNREVYDENIAQGYQLTYGGNPSTIFSGNSNYGNYTGDQGEMGIGYYTNTGSKTMIDIAAGVGFGTLSRTGQSVIMTTTDDMGNVNEYNLSFNFNSKYTNYFVQGAFGLVSKHASFKAGIKASFRDFTSMSYYTPLVEHFINDNYQSGTILNNTHAYLQPFVDFEVGGRIARYNIQAGVSDEVYDWSFAGMVKAYVCMGLALNLNPDKK